MKTTIKFLLIKTAIFAVFCAAVATIVWSADPPADETATVTVKTKPRIMRVVVDYDESGNLVNVTAYLFRLRFEDDIPVDVKQWGSTNYTRGQLVAADNLRSNLVMRLEGFSTWAKARWNEAQALPENP